LAELATFDVVLKAHQVGEDGEPRWRDTDLGEWLELSRSRSIRAVIEANRQELEEYGNLPSRMANSGSVGRPSKEYWLTFDQSLVICQLSQSRNGREVRRVLIKVFKYVMNGSLATAPRMALRAIDVAAESVIRPLMVRLDRLECKQEYFDHKLHDQERGRFSKKSRDVFMLVVVMCYGGTCPCCGETRIIVDGRLVVAETDHFFGKRKSRIDQGWLTCRPCNRKLDDLVFRYAKQQAFDQFQTHVKHIDRQLSFDMPPNAQ
jgi:hypothetical protein